jgi:superfamily II DNA/RNA helicase
MGFIPDIERICKLLPLTRQTLFFSATMPPEIQRLTSQFLHHPQRVEAAPPATTAASIQQHVVRVPAEAAAKRAALRDLLRSRGELKNAIIFSNRKTTVAVLEKSLVKHGFNAAALHGDMDQRARIKTLDAFRAGRITYLIASDVAARGLDIPDVSHVFIFDVPVHAEDYVHRVGRTGRAGRAGDAVMLVTANELKSLRAIEQLIRMEIPWDGGLAAGEENRELSRRSHPNQHRRMRFRAGAQPTEPRARRDTRAHAGPERNRASSPPKKPADAKPVRDKQGTAAGFRDHVPAFLQRPVR